MPYEVRILLAEDDEFDARLTLQVLAKATDAATLVVPDGKEALDYLYRRGHYVDWPPVQPSLILLDLKMPRVDGFGVLAQIKTDPTLKAIPAVMLTSSCQPADLTRAYQLGANAYVAKSMAFVDYIAALGQLQRYWLLVNQVAPPCHGWVRREQEITTTPPLNAVSPRGNVHKNPAFRLLLAEDDPYDAQVVLQTLQMPAEQVLTVRHGQEALEFLHRRGRFAVHPMLNPTLILLDLKMPQVDGFEVLEDLKGAPALRVVPVVVLTGSPDQGDIARAYALGANGYVVKDLDPSFYVAALREMKRFWLEVNELPPACVGRISR